MADSRSGQIPASSLEAFRNVLKNNRDIILLHKGKRYKARDVTEVLFSEMRRDKGGASFCLACGGDHVDIHIVKAKEIIFLVWDSSGCLIYNSRAEIVSFTCMDELKARLERWELDAPLRALFPKTTVEENCGDTTSTDTDSY